jgi:fatty-acyl-CoA synthase
MSLLSSVLASGGSMLLRKRFSVSRFWSDIRKYKINFTQYSGEMCRYLLNETPRVDDHRHTLRFLTGAGLDAPTYTAFAERFRVRRIIEGYGGTELNIGMMNVDGVPGSCGRVPYKDKSIVRLVKYDMEKQEHVRDKQGFMVECAAGEVGEIIGMIMNLENSAAGRFEGYTDAHATEAKILRNVFRQGDTWLSTGDLMRRDKHDCFYFVDRLGDTFRWKSENVSTTEVSEALGLYPGIASVNVYGVKVPGHEGRAGMATIVISGHTALDAEDLYEFASEKLPPYAVPMFLRVSKREDATATLKLRKITLQKRGYAPDDPEDMLFVCHHQAGCFAPLNDALLEQLGIPPFKPS